MTPKNIYAHPGVPTIWMDMDAIAAAGGSFDSSIYFDYSESDQEFLKSFPVFNEFKFSIDPYDSLSEEEYEEYEENEKKVDIILEKLLEKNFGKKTKKAAPRRRSPYIAY